MSKYRPLNYKYFITVETPVNTERTNTDLNGHIVMFGITDCCMWEDEEGWARGAAGHMLTGAV